MNDPGLDGPVAQADGQVQNKVKKEDETEMDEEEQEKSLLLPAKWWYASTAIPLMAGTFGPMANAFSICALVENWRVKVPKGGTEEHGIDIPDPKWLIAVNAVSLVLALIANLALLLNMARRLRFAIAQPITIVGFWAASILLIGLLAKAAHDFHAPGVPNQALTQAYYYGIFAAGLYQIISYLMCITVWGAHQGYYRKEFKLTVAQRTLMLQTISFLVYQHLGALVYSKIEDWNFLDAVYWADFTLLTIGIGDDYVPKTHLGRGLLFPFALGGIVILGLVVGSIRSLVLDRSKVKMAARMTEKTRRRVVKRVANAEKATNNKARLRKLTGLDTATATILTSDPQKLGISEIQRRHAEFEAMRRVQEMAANERKWISLLTSTFAFAFLWTIGAFIFYEAEKDQQWSYFESLYFSYTTLLTIGYGDFQPESNSGKPFFVFWSLLAVPTLTILISNMGDTVVKGVKDFTIWLGEISVLPSENVGTIDRLRYGLYKATLGKVDVEKGKAVEDEESLDDADDDLQRFQELNPGLIKMYSRPNENRRAHWRRKNAHTGEELASAFEQSERQEEAEAKSEGNELAEDEHHFRHILISQIRKVWNDVNSDPPKKYSYAEWAYYLRLLGEDENDRRFHRRPTAKRAAQALKEAEDNEKNQHAGLTPSGVVKHGTDLDKPRQVTKWSWMGPNSPLLANDDEPSWLLQKLFIRLEDSLSEHWASHHKDDMESAAGPKEGGTEAQKGQGEDGQEDAIRPSSSDTLGE